MAHTEPLDPALEPEALLEQHRWVRDLAHRLVRDPHAADDVAQQAWVKVLQRPPGRIESMRAWLATVVRNCARDRHRAEGRRADREAAMPPPQEPRSAADLVAHAEAQRRVLDVVLGLDPVDRDLVLMRYFDGLEPRDIAERLGQPGGTVRSRLHRALAEVRTRLDAAHGGDTSAWAIALLGPQGWARAAGPAATMPPGSAATAAGRGLVTMTTNAKLALGAAAAVMAAVLFWQMGGPEPVSPPAGEETAALQQAAPPLPADLVAASAPADEDTDPGEEAIPAVAPPPAEPEPAGPRRLEVTRLPEPGAAAPAPTGTVSVPEGTRVIVAGEGRRVSVGEGAGMMVPAGRGSKWHPAPETGTVTLKGRVVDISGRPIDGAVIHRLEAEAGGVEGDVVSFQHIKEIGKSGPDGRFEITGQPARAVRLQGNFLRGMHRPRGLLLANLVPVDPGENAVVDALELRVPMDSTAVGRISGTVVDDRGDPVGRVRIFAGHLEARSGRDGSFSFPGVPSGEVRLRPVRYGFAATDHVVNVERGAEATTEIVLRPEKEGTLVLEGTVVDDSGLPVAGVPMWMGGGYGVTRDDVTDEHGRFTFERLPDSVEKAGVTVSVMTNPDTSDIMPRTVQKVRVPTAGFVVEVERTVRVHVRVVDATTGEPVRQFNASVWLDTEIDGVTNRVRRRGASLWEEDGTWTFPAARGPLELVVEAPDRVTWRGEVVIDDLDGEKEILVEM